MVVDLDMDEEIGEMKDTVSCNNPMKPLLRFQKRTPCIMISLQKVFTGTISAVVPGLLRHPRS